MRRFDKAVWCALMLAVTLGISGCFRRTFVVVPQRAGGYTQRDTLYATREGNQYRVVFRHDTTWRVDTVVQLDTLWRGGTRYIVDTLYRVIRDTIYFPAPVTGPVKPGTPGGQVPRVPGPTTTPRRDTIYLPDPGRGRDTVYLPRPGSGNRIDTIRVVVRDTVRITVRDTIRLGSRDTVRVTVRDTLRIVVRDTVRVGGRDTVVVAGGRRLMHVPPGQFPRDGQCRIWLADRAPGQQARAAPCDQLGSIPPGAFVLFNDVAWDMDYDWAAESRRTPIPPQILALNRRGSP